MNRQPPNPQDSKPQLREGEQWNVSHRIREMLLGLELPLKTCVTCIHFNEGREHCGFYGGRPPARVIAFGCKTYTHDDEIPF